MPSAKNLVKFSKSGVQLKIEISQSMLLNLEPAGAGGETSEAGASSLESFMWMKIQWVKAEGFCISKHGFQRDSGVSQIIIIKDSC